MKKFKVVSTVLLWVACLGCLCYGVYSAFSFNLNMNGSLGIVPSETYEAVTLPAEWFNSLSGVTTSKSAVKSITISKRAPAQNESYISIPNGPNISYTLSSGKYSIEIWWPGSINAPSNSSNLFSGYSSLTGITFSNFNTNNVEDMNGMFDGCSSLTSLSLSSFNTSNVEDMSGMFDGCSSLTSLSLSSFNTSNVADMGEMFRGCSGLTSLSLTSFNTGKVASMSYMFYGCSKLTELNLSYFDLKSLTSASYMFDGCTTLATIYAPRISSGTLKTSPPLPGTFLYNSTTTTSISSSFLSTATSGSGRKTLTRIALLTNDWFAKLVSASSSSITKAKVKTISFKTSLTSGYTSGTSYQDVKMGYKSVTGGYAVELYSPFPIYAPSNSSNLFSGYSSLTGITFTNFNTSGVSNMSYMFDGCSSLTSLNLSSFNTSSVSNMSYMFRNCSGFTTLNLYPFDGASVTDLSYMFYGCSKLTSLSFNSGEVTRFVPSQATNMSYMFYNCENLTSVPALFHSANISNLSYMFYNCKKLTYLSMSQSDLKSLTTATNMFNGCDALAELVAPKCSTTLNATITLPGFFLYNGNYTSSITNSNQGTYLSKTLTRIALLTKDWHTKLVSASSGSITKAKVKTISFKTSLTSGYTSGTSYQDIKMGYKSVTGGYAVELYSPFPIYAPADSRYLFGDSEDYYEALTSIDFTNFNTSLVTNMSYMFANSSALTPLSLSSFNTSLVTNMSYMFSGCSGLTSITLSSFNTSLVTNMSSMFRGCSGLTSITLSSFNTSKVTDMSYMFDGCSSLTSLSVSSLETSIVTNMSYMLRDCSGLTSLSFVDFDTANVTNMSYMFDGCSGLSSLSLTSFTTSKVTNMAAMFRNCSGLTSITLTSFNTSIVTTMAYMFQNCSKLTSLNLSYFDLKSITTANNMFLGCTNLGTIYAPQSSSGTLKTSPPLPGTFLYNSTTTTSISSSFLSTATSGSGRKTLTRIALLTNDWFAKLVTAVSVLTPNNIETISFKTSLTSGYSTNATNTYQDVHLGFKSATFGYAIEIYSNFPIYAPADCLGLFLNMVGLRSITFTNFNTSLTTNMESMFNNCSNLTSLNLSSFNTSKVTNMNSMFTGCSNLTSITFSSSFDTSKVQEMRGMFYDCKKLNNLDLSYFDLVSLTYADTMFTGCTSLTNMYTPRCSGTMKSVISLPNTFYIPGTNIRTSAISSVNCDTFLSTATSGSGKTQITVPVG